MELKPKTTSLPKQQDDKENEGINFEIYVPNENNNKHHNITYPVKSRFNS